MLTRSGLGFPGLQQRWLQQFPIGRAGTSGTNARPSASQAEGPTGLGGDQVCGRGIAFFGRSGVGLSPPFPAPTRLIQVSPCQKCLLGLCTERVDAGEELLVRLLS